MLFIWLLQAFSLTQWNSERRPAIQLTAKRSLAPASIACFQVSLHGFFLFFFSHSNASIQYQHSTCRPVPLPRSSLSHPGGCSQVGAERGGQRGGGGRRGWKARETEAGGKRGRGRHVSWDGHAEHLITDRLLLYQVCRLKPQAGITGHMQAIYPC